MFVEYGILFIYKKTWISSRRTIIRISPRHGDYRRTSKKLKIGWNRLTHRPRAVRICVIARDFFIMVSQFIRLSALLNPFIWIVLWACSNLFWDYFSKQYIDIPTKSVFFFLMILGYIGSGVGYTLGFYQIRQYFVSEVVYYATVTIGSVFLWYYLFWERLHGLQLIGSILCLSGIVCVIISSR